MGNSVDDRVSDGCAFANERWKDGDHWRQIVLISNSARKYDGGVRSPHGDPQRNVDQSDFGDANLGALRILISIGSKRSHVHFLSLFPQSFLVVSDGFDNVEIAEENDGQRSAVV